MNINFDGDLRTDSEEEEEEEEISDVGTVNPCWQNAPQQLCKYLYAQVSRAHVMRKSKRFIHESVTRLTILTSKELRYRLLTFTIFIIQSQVGAIPVFSRLFVLPYPPSLIARHVSWATSDCLILAT